MDIFDPTTGEVRSSGGADLKNDVAAWFINDDYNEESFFVRQAYFVGQDPYDALDADAACPPFGEDMGLDRQ
jgi:adenine-specific DNA-methyltransferase